MDIYIIVYERNYADDYEEYCAIPYFTSDSFDNALNLASEVASSNNRVLKNVIKINLENSNIYFLDLCYENGTLTFITKQ